jgi:hypothetical protein
MRTTRPLEKFKWKTSLTRGPRRRLWKIRNYFFKELSPD